MNIKGMVYLFFLLILAACSKTPEWDVSIEKPPFFKDGVQSPFVINVNENSEALSELTIIASFEMKKMDHGTIEVELIEKNPGEYEGYVELPMAGDYDVLLKMDDGNHQKEELLSIKVEQEKAVAIIHNQKIFQEDLDFYQFINKLHIAINREVDKEKFSGEEYTQAMEYWNTQEKLAENENTLLTQIIRLRSVALLAEEKGYQASNAEIEEEIHKVKEQYAENKKTLDMIKEYGEDKFWEKEKSQYSYIVLANKIQKEIITKVKKENPNTNENEVMYLAQKQYEELLVSQVNSLKIELLNKKAS